MIFIFQEPLRECDDKLEGEDMPDEEDLMYTVQDLTPYTNYSVIISGVNPGGVGDESSSKVTRTDEDSKCHMSGYYVTLRSL